MTAVLGVGGDVVGALTATAAQLEHTIRSHEGQCGTQAQERERLDKLRLNIFANDDCTANVAGRLTRARTDHVHLRPLRRVVMF